jgi:putative MATE family efflux protein
MFEGKPRELFARFAIPQMIGLLFNSVYTIVDGVFIGNRLGRETMAAAAVAVPLIEILISVAIAVAAGAGVLIAARLGSGKGDEARGLFNTAAWMMGAAGLGVALLGNLCLEPLALLLGAAPEVLPQAMAYLWYIVTFAPFQLFSFLLGGMARNDGRPKLAMTAMIAGAASNIVLDYVFMYPLNLGIRGAALATALGPIFSVLILLPHFLLRRGTLYFQAVRPRLAEGRSILVCGAPSFLMEFSIGIVTFLYNVAVSRHGYGELGLAAYLIIGYLMLILLTLFLGMAEGLQPVFSRFMATGEEKRNLTMRRFSTKVFLGVGVISCLLIFLGSRWFFLLFAPEDPELTAFAASRSIPYFCGFFLTGFNILMISFLQATRQTGRAMVLSLLRSVILPPALLLLLPALLGREGVWVCQSAADALTALFAICFLAFPARSCYSKLG